MIIIWAIRSFRLRERNTESTQAESVPYENAGTIPLSLVTPARDRKTNPMHKILFLIAVTESVICSAKERKMRIDRPNLIHIY